MRNTIFMCFWSRWSSVSPVSVGCKGSLIRYNPGVTKILVRVPQWLGDAVVSTVFLSRLRAQHPNAEIAVAAAPGVAPVFETHPDVNEVIQLPYPKGTVFAAARKLKERHFDEVYILPRSFRTALESFLAGIPKRIGYGGDLRRLLLTDVRSYDSNHVYAHRYLALIGEENFPLINVRPYFPSAPPPVPPELKKPVLGIGPSSVAPARTWFPERFIEVANRFLKERGGTVVLFGSPSERAASDRVRQGIKGNCIDTTGGLKLPELGWFVSQCDLMLVNDSGLMHVASAFQVPTAVLFGPSEPRHAIPAWGKFIPIQHGEISCVPCLRNECVRFGDGYMACMKAITPAEVDAALNILEKNPS